METSPAEFIDELVHRLEALPDDSSAREKMLNLSDSQDSFLSLDDGSLASTLPAIAARFAQCWPEDMALSSPGAIKLVGHARTHDKQLQKMSDKLVPKKVAERAFWRHYFSRVHALLVEAAPSPGDQLACHIDGLPKPRTAEERRFQPAAELQASGDIPRAKLLKFITECTKMVSSDESLKLATRAVAIDGADIAAVMLTAQLEFMESMGIDRRFGVAMMSPSVVEKVYPKDAELKQALETFMRTCQQAGQMAMSQAMMRASADPSKRRVPPAAELQESGDLDTERLVQMVEGVMAMISSKDLRAQLMDACREGQGNPEVVLMRYQREYFESTGLEQDFAVGQLRALAGRAQAAIMGGQKNTPEIKAFEGLRDMSSKVSELARSVMVELSRPKMKEGDDRRFKPKATPEGEPAELQTKGPLSREVVVRFCEEANKMLISDESIDLLAKMSEQEAGPASVAWQREYLEHLGVQQVRARASLGGAQGRSS